MASVPTHEVVALLDECLVWDNHACMPLRNGDVAFLDQLDRCRLAGCDVVSLNVGFGPKSLEDHLRALALFRGWIAERGDSYRVARTLADIDAARVNQQLAVIFDIEGMAPLDQGDHGMIALLRELGVAWMLIAYNKNNAAGGGCTDEDAGLTGHGRATLKEMKRVGMLACCSHTGHRTAFEVLEAADNPVIFSHSNAAAVWPHYRNIPDDLIRGCAETGGVVGVNGIGDFLGEGSDYVDLLIRHIDHIAELVGCDHIGLGLDYVFDVSELIDYLKAHPELFGENPNLNVRMAPPEVIPDLVAGLLARGYSRADLAGILGGNWRRVAGQVWLS